MRSDVSPVCCGVKAVAKPWRAMPHCQSREPSREIGCWLEALPRTCGSTPLGVRSTSPGSRRHTLSLCYTNHPEDPRAAALPVPVVETRGWRCCRKFDRILSPTPVPRQTLITYPTNPPSEHGSNPVNNTSRWRYLGSRECSFEKSFRKESLISLERLFFWYQVRSEEFQIF